MIKKLIKCTLCSTVLERIISILILAVTLLSCVGYSQVSFPPFISLPDSHLCDCIIIKKYLAPSHSKCINSLITETVELSKDSLW